MRIVIQRVSEASVAIDAQVHARIGAGLLIFLGIEDEDQQEDVDWLSKKIIQLRIFDDHKGIMNRSVRDVDGDILVISQFTLHAKTKKGNRPSYIKAAAPEHAIPLYEAFLQTLEKQLEKPVFSGRFGACMKVSLENDGPVTIWMDSKHKE